MSHALAELGRMVAEAFGNERQCRLDVPPGAAEAMVVHALLSQYQQTIVWICDGPKSLATRHHDLISIDRTAAGPGRKILFYPADESLLREAGAADPEIEGERLNVLSRLADSADPAIVVTSIQATMQATLTPDELREGTVRLSVGGKMEVADLADRLQRAGYRFLAEIGQKGQASVRGGLVDVWPVTENWPLRLEFDGTTLESVRTFDPVEQRSVNRIETACLPPAVEPDSTARKSRSGAFPAYLPNSSLIVWSDMQSIEQNSLAYRDMLAGAGQTAPALSFSTLQAGFARNGFRELIAGGVAEADMPEANLGFVPTDGASAPERDAIAPDVMEETRRRLLADIAERSDSGRKVYVFFDTAGSLDRFRETHPGDAARKGIRLEVGAISDGFINDKLGLMVVPESDLYGRKRSLAGRYDPGAGSARPQTTGVRIDLPSELQEGDLVVHVQHGIGRYAGLSTIVFDNKLQEVLTIEYAEGGILHVPVSHSHLLSRYVGIGERSVSLHRLGGKRWQKEKTLAGLAVRDFAASLLETQAARETLEGHRFSRDTPWQHEFEAAFPYRETPDQEDAIRQVKRDMENSKPMDRLICGDVGFGKTEVAVRAAFKAVMDGKQAAVLVPTTVLCQQHFNTFSERVAAFPVRVEMLSRFCSRGRCEAILEGVRDGSVDIVIGTHSLLQAQVEFANLGLVIIDEEQRFGVRHKEKLKQMRRLVDVLTLTATPIPRTLYMSMIGIKDLSIVQTPPEHRLPIETIVTRNSDAIIRDAILREISRQGQVYYLHNRVATIDRVLGRLRRIVPEARVAVGHGQMSSSELASVMEQFVGGLCDVLLCTTIIESGLDIPNVNTIVIDRADRFGLADLYQLRGRVGRSARKAYAYLLLPEHNVPDPVVRKRIGIIRRYSELGSGFQLALRDLEFRGAGNLLGLEQSGHATAIGFLLYCQFLKHAVSQLKGEKPKPIVDVTLNLDFIDLSPDAAAADNCAAIPTSYVTDRRQRTAAYRGIAETATLSEVETLAKNLKDRFGPLPASLERLLRLAAVRVLAADKSVAAIETDGDKLLVKRGKDYITLRGRMPRLKGTTPNDKIEDIFRTIKEL